MNYKLLFIFLIFMQNFFINSLEKFSNQNFLYTQPLICSFGLHQASWNDFAYTKRKKNGSALQIYGMGAISIETPFAAQYFLFDCKDRLTVVAGSLPANYTVPGTPNPLNPTQGEINVQSFNRDILGQWLNFTQTTAQTFTFNPTQTQESLMFEFNQDLKIFTDIDFLQYCFISISMPLTYLKNNIGFQGDQSILDAFNQKQFCSGKICASDQTSTKLTQIKLLFGAEYMHEEDSQVVATTGIIIPLGEPVCQSYLFYPVQAYNDHFGLCTQAFFEFPICKKTPTAKSRICFFFGFEDVFLARNHRLRTYDIKQKPYSRYMKLLDRYTNDLIPAINTLTIRSRIEPFNIVNMITGFRCKFKDSIGEVGYELWAHGDETITPQPDQCQWQDDRYAIPFIGQDGQLAQINSITGAVEPLTPGAPGQSASNSTINYISAPDGNTNCCGADPVFTQQNKYIRLADLNTLTPAARAAITQRAYMSIGFGHKGNIREYFVNFGLFIESSNNNAALSYLGGWAKFGYLF